MLRKLLIVSLGSLLCLASFTMGLLVNAFYFAPEVGRGRLVRVTVDSGEPFSEIAERLSAEGLIRFPALISSCAAILGYDRRIRAGTYQWTVGEKPKDIVAALIRGEVLKVNVTVPEGFTLRQIAGLLRTSAGMDSTSFVEAASSPKLLSDLGIQAPTLEGYLFPDTYSIPWGMDEEDAIRIMVARLQGVFNEDMKRRSKELRMSRHQALTLASIVEAETRLPAERALVSAVYHNRLRRGMKLEADPTVAYALGDRKGMLSRQDLSVESPYNTYLNYGLPPGPICSPGRASLLAALYPDPSCRAIYFVASGDGGHIFSLTLDDHLSAVMKLKKRRNL